MRVLLVEDYELLGEAVADGLRKHGYIVDWVTDGNDAQNSILMQSFDAVILDLGLPNKSGIEILRCVRKNNISTPILVLTARDSVSDKVEALDSGADDYMVKPFDIDELCARVRALQRRSSARTETVIENGPITLVPSTYTVKLNDAPLTLSRREFALLFKMMECLGNVVDRESLTQSLYGWDDDVESNAIEVHIHNLRKKIGDVMPIVTVRGVGYMVKKL